MRFKRPTFPKITLKKPQRQWARFAITWPKIQVPALRWPQLNLPKLSLPKIAVPRIALPKIQTSKIHLPKVQLPTLQLPAVKLPQIAWPKLALPKLSLPAMTLPRFQKPAIAWPALSVPKITRPNITLAQVRCPRLKLPKLAVKIPAIKWPAWPRLNPLYCLQTLAVVVFCASVLGAFVTGFVTMNGVRAAGLSAIDFIKTAQILPSVSVDADEPAEHPNSFLLTSGTEPPAFMQEDGGRYQVEEQTIEVEAVLIPRDTTVISSSQDSKIKAINFDNGETFKKGDVLVEYDCKDVRAEVEIAKTQQELTAEKSETSYKLFKLDIISNIEKLELESENKQAEARINLYESRMESCFIRAEYDGRVVKRLANAGEFTRTDRVLMEVASLHYLKAEFLLPSRWLRWVNVGAPITLAINETEKTYDATIQYIYGEVDPVSQSIQMTAQLEGYPDPLLPGMSGKATIDIGAIRKAGIYGFLEVQPSSRP